MLLLRRAGIADPARVVGLIRRTITFFELDLSGLVVLTEAASGPYVVTPIIAALAGAARVIALTATSRYGSVEAVIAQTRALAELCGVSVQVDDASAGAAGDENLIPDPSPAARGASRPTRRGEDAAPPSLAGKGVGGSGATCRAGPVAVSTARRPELFAAADIITNLGFVRPI
ncbi:MAG: hypothetical protein N2439_04145, partial [Anaerolineae bacterium]|nr:hypothetical protein [Anaerolineae bacterium]